MKKIVIITTGALFLAICCISYSQAQNFGNQRGYNNQYERTYDINTIETIEVEIDQIRYHRGRRSGATGVEIEVQTSEEKIVVHLGPSWYLERQEPLKEGEQVIITGSRVIFNENEILVAAEVQRGDMIMKLRDENGYPVWRGWRSRS